MAHQLVADLLAACTDSKTAEAQAGIIVRELCRAGMLVGAELNGMMVVETSGAPAVWWSGPANADAVADQRGRRTIGGYQPQGAGNAPVEAPNQSSSVRSAG